MGGRVPGPAGANNGGATSKAASQQNGIAPLRVIMFPGGLITTAPLLTPDDVEAAARYVRDCARNTGEQLDREIRVQFEDAAIRIGNIPAGFPRELLHRYIFGNYDTLYLTPDEFIAKVDPFASVIEPNKATNGSGFTDDLQRDLNKLAATASSSAQVGFFGKYAIGAFHGAHRTAGLGRMTLMVNVYVTASSPTDWELLGTAMLKAERWDFDWEMSTLLKELWDGGVSFDRQDLRGRERRTALGSSIPGHPFYVAMTASVQVSQTAGDEWATFFV